MGDASGAWSGDRGKKTRCGKLRKIAGGPLSILPGRGPRGGRLQEPDDRAGTCTPEAPWANHRKRTPGAPRQTARPSIDGAIGPTRRCLRTRSRSSIWCAGLSSSGSASTGPWVERLDFSTLERVPTEHIAPDLSSRINDTVWRVRLRDAKTSEAGGWLHVLVMVEFQSELDWFMALRIRTYADLLYASLWKDRRPRRTDRLPALLPVVLYTGAQRWSAASSVEALVAPQIVPGARPVAAPVFSGASYIVVDTGTYAGRDLPAGNVVSLMIGAQLRPDASTALDIVAAARRLGEELGRTFLTWLRVAMSGTGVDLEFLEDPMALERLEHTGELGGLLEERFRAANAAQIEVARAEGREAARAEEQEAARAQIEAARAEGQEIARAEGQEIARAEERGRLCRLAARKFGAATAERLAIVLKGVDDGDRLAVVGERIIDCADGAALLASLESQA